MHLSLQHRQVGDVTIITCRGQLVSGAEADALLKRIDDLLELNPRILLHLGEVDFIDSGGLGLLVRCLTRVQNAAGQLSVCALSPKVSDVLRVTRLDTVLQPHYTEADAIASVHTDTLDRQRDDAGSLILCVDASSDVLVYVRGLIKAAGHRVATAENLYDGLMLLKAMQPRVVVMGAGLHAMRETASAEEFHRRIPPGSLIVLPTAFSTRDAADAASALLREVQSIVSGRRSGPQPA
jgi:anti-sigma B factor antagonist